MTRVYRSALSFDKGLLLALLGLLSAVARLPLIRTPVDVSPDGCEYLGIARHLVSERRWVSSLQ